jgi:hypothetical protein
MIYFPETSTTLVPGGSVTSDSEPTVRIRPSVITSTPFSNGGAFVPSMMVAPTKAIVPSFARAGTEDIRNPNKAKIEIIVLIMVVSS